MALLVPHEGELQLLTDMIGGGTLENWQLCLFNSSITPSETDTAATYMAHETTFAGYAPVTLTRSISASTWNTPTIGNTGNWLLLVFDEPEQAIEALDLLWAAINSLTPANTAKEE